MKILVTGFDPFGGEKVNPAIEAVKKLPDEIMGVQIIKLEIPTSFKRAPKIIREVLEKEDVDYCLNVGQAGGRAAITPERVAINWDEGSISDNDGYKPLGKKIDASAPDGYFTQLLINEMVAQLCKNGLPAKISNSAGTYVCNHVFYSVQRMRAENFPKLKAGFVHIPYLPQQVVNKPNVASMSLENIVKGLKIILETIINGSKSN